MDPKLAFESTMMFLAKALHSILNRLAAKRKWPYWTLIKNKKGIRRRKCTTGRQKFIEFSFHVE